MDSEYESRFEVIAHANAGIVAQWIAHMPQLLQLYQPRYQMLTSSPMESTHAPTLAVIAYVPNANKCSNG